jgi:hypothetical protein
MKLSATSYDAGEKDNLPLYHWLTRTSVSLSPLLAMTVTRLLSVRHGLSGEASTVRNAMMLDYALQPWLFKFTPGCLDGWTLLHYVGGERRVQAMVGQTTKLICAWDEVALRP